MFKDGYQYTQTLFDDEKFKQTTENVYKVQDVQPYNDKKGKLPDGVKLTLTILKDHLPHKESEVDGFETMDNVGTNFDVTVLSRDVIPKRGQFVRLGEIDQDNTFIIKFDFILRYKSIQVVNVNQQQTQKASK